MTTYVEPPVTLDEISAEVLHALAISAPDDGLSTARSLLREIERATILPANQLPAGVVRIGTRLVYGDQRTGLEREGTIVLPSAADIDQSRISVLSPVGAALIGLAEEAVIRWSIGRRDAELRVVKVGRFAPETIYG